MNVSKTNRRREAAAAASDQMESAGFDPLKRLMEMVDEEIDPPHHDDPDIAKSILRSMLCTDYEPAPNGRLRLRARLRADILLKLQEYRHPRLKASEEPGGGESAPIVLEIVQYTPRTNDTDPTSKALNPPGPAAT